MTDIVERLKSGEALESKTPRLKTYPLMLAAADEIERLRSEVAMLRTGDTCARQCEGTAYRIEARKLKAEVARLRVLLAHAVAKADGWHDDARGGPIEGDTIIDEARRIISEQALQALADEAQDIGLYESAIKETAHTLETPSSSPA